MCLSFFGLSHALFLRKRTANIYMYKAMASLVAKFARVPPDVSKFTGPVGAELHDHLPINTYQPYLSI